MLRPTIKQGDSDGSGATVGGLPAVACPGPQATTYTLPFQSQWGADAPVEYRPMLLIGCAVADVTPGPAFPLTITLGLSLPTSPLVGAPTADDVPTEFQTMNVNVVGSGGQIGMQLPVNVVGDMIGFDHQFWLRFSSVDALGCTTEVFAFLPAGVPADVTLAPLVVYALSGGLVEQFIVDPPAAADEGTALSAVQNVTATSVCPAPQRAVAVAPACGFEVQIVQDDPLPVSVAGTVPVSVESPAAVFMEMATVLLCGSGPATTATRTVPAGAKIVTFAFSLPTDDATVLIGDAVGKLQVHAADGPLTWTAPDGFLLPSIEVSYFQGSTTGQCISFTTFSPPT